MQTSVIAAFLSLSLIAREVASRYCTYKPTEDKIGAVDCGEPPENIEGIFLPEGNIPVIKKGLFAPFKSLESIYLGRLNVEKVEPGAFDGLKLKNLQLNNNNIKKIGNGTLNSLTIATQFEMTFNQLESLEADIFLGMASVVWISLSANKIKTIDKSAFNGLTKLDHFFLAHNKIESLAPGTFDSLISLTLLDLSYNTLKEIKFGLFSHQRHLKKLNLQQNQIEGLPDHLFDNLTAINTIDVSENKIQELQENLFYGIENLEILQFETNKITQFNSRSLLVHLPRLEKVYLAYNPWKCENLKKIRGDFEIKNVVVPVLFPVYDTPNVDGIGCSE